MEDGILKPIRIKEEIFDEESPESLVKKIESPSHQSIINEAAQEDYLVTNSGTNYFIKSEPLDVKVEDVKEEFESPSVSLHQEPTSEITIETRLLESKKLLIARKTDIQTLSGKRVGPILYNCSCCPYQNPKKRNVEKHALIHKKSKEFKCDLCTYECHWKSWLVRHKQRHEVQPREYKCDKCDYKARFKICLDRHILNHDKLKPFSCPLCSYKGNSQAYLRSHMTIHSKIKPYSCPKCDSSYTRKRYLLIHLKSHSLSKLRKSSKIPFTAKAVSGGFECGMCDYRCMRKTTLKKHLKHHFSPQEYPCDKCSYKANRKDILDSHKLTHSTVKKFECDMCDFKSHWSHCLRRHMFVRHLNFRPFKCAECEYSSADKSNLKKHVSNHLEALYCQLCKIEFKARSNLTRHKNKFHKPSLQDSGQLEDSVCTEA